MPVERSLRGPRAGLAWMAAMVLLLAATATSAKAPSNKRPTDEERGQELYDRHCFQCHGARVDGQGPATTALVRPVPSLVNAVKVDDATVQVVLRGKGVMPAFETSFDRADARRVLQHMKRLADGEGDDEAEGD